MPYENGWYIERRVIFQRIYGDVTLADLEKNLHETNELLEAGISPIHVMCDVREISKFPMNINQLKDLYQMAPNPNAGFTILLSSSSVLRFFLSIIVQIVKTDYKMVNTDEEALELLRRIDPTLNGLVPVTFTLPGDRNP